MSPGIVVICVFLGGMDVTLSDFDVKEATSPAPPNSGGSSLCWGADEKLYLSWTEEKGTPSVHCSVSDGERWSKAVDVYVGPDLLLNWADYPSLAVLEDGTLAAHRLVSPDPETPGYAVQVLISTDRGETWERRLRPHRDATNTEHGFVSLLPLASDRFGMFWLDGREMAGSAPSGSMTLRYTSFTKEGELGPEVLVDDRVCECCQTSATRLDDGRLLVAYRDLSKDDIRDIAVASITGAKVEARTSVHADNWKSTTCPVNGPEIDSLGQTVAVAWFTEPEPGKGKVQLAFSNDGGRSFSSPLRVDDGNPIGRVDVALLPDASALVSWIEAGIVTTIRLRHLTAAGRIGPALRAFPSDESHAAGFPRLVRAGVKAALAWVSPEEGRVRTAWVTRKK